MNSASAGSTLDRMKDHMRTFNRFEALQEDVAEEDEGGDPVAEKPPSPGNWHMAPHPPSKGRVDEQCVGSVGGGRKEHYVHATGVGGDGAGGD